METQTYSEVTQVILKELKDNKPDFKGLDYQEYFYNLKLKNPEKYEKLTFNTKNQPFSRDLSKIFFGLIVCGFLDLENNILFE